MYIEREAGLRVKIIHFARGQYLLLCKLLWRLANLIKIVGQKIQGFPTLIKKSLLRTEDIFSGSPVMHSSEMRKHGAWPGLRKIDIVTSWHWIIGRQTAGPYEIALCSENMPYTASKKCTVNIVTPMQWGQCFISKYFQDMRFEKLSILHQESYGTEILRKWFDVQW